MASTAIQVANVSRRFPQILVALFGNRMSLTVAGLLAPVLTESNVEKLLADCAGMSKREVEEYLVALRPKPVLEPSIRKTPSRPQEGLWASSSPPSEPSTAPPVQDAARPAPRSSAPLLQPARPEHYNFRFAADRKFKEKFERLAEVLGVENPLQHMAEILEQALDGNEGEAGRVMQRLDGEAEVTEDGDVCVDQHVTRPNRVTFAAMHARVSSPRRR